MTTAHKQHKTALTKQTGQSMTQYLVLTFMLAVGSLLTIGNASQVGRHQVAAISHEVAGSHSESIKSTKAAQDSSKYASSSASAPTNMGGSSPSNPVTNPTGPNTTPAVTPTGPSTPTDNPVVNPTGPNTTPVTPTPVDPNTNPIINPTNPADPITTPLGPDTPVVDEPPKPEIKCTTPTPEEDDGSTKKEEDKGFWGSLWDEVKDGLVAGYEFVKGFWEGMKKQVADLGDLLAHPIDTAKGLIELGKQFVKEPAKTAKMIADALGEEFKTLVECGAFDKGRIIGENVSPAFMIKLASKMAKFGDLAKALKETKKDFGCASFAAGTPIWTPDGKVNIESLVKGNTVLSRERQSYNDKPQKIEKTFGRTAPSYYQLTTEFGTINVTEEHPMWKQGIGWTEAQYLKVDDVVASATGDVLILDNQIIDKPLQVYNFSVENTPSYFAGVGQLWVHNAKCAITPSGTKAIAKNENGDYIDPLDKAQTPIHIVDFPNKDKVNFIGNPVPIKLKPGTIIYRIYGGNAGKTGPYWSLDPPKNLSQTRKDLAVFEGWNDGSKIVKYEVKEGDNIGGWVGQASPQNASTHGLNEPDLSGGKDQIYIDAWNIPESRLENVDLPEGWYD